MRGKWPAPPCRGARAGMAMLALMAACSNAPDWQPAPTPQAAPGTTVTLRVVQAINPRLPRMSDEQVAALLATTKAAAARHFGVTLKFMDVGEVDVADLLAAVPSAIRAEREKSIYDWKQGSGDRARLVAGIRDTLEKSGNRFEDMREFAAPHLSGPPPTDKAALADALATALLARLAQWRALPAADGRPVVDGAPYNEWTWWDALGYAGWPYDIVITNQLIVGAEYYGVDVHTAIRGGVTVGTTTWAANERHALVFWSTFPFQSDAEAVRSLRGGERYAPQEAAELAGAYLAHEIGHLLFRFGHPFGQRACVMNPVELLRFRAWRAGLDADACRPGSRPQMQVGAAPLWYSTVWAARVPRP